ncbi:HD domain-containing phosphohydrolase [Nostocoides sp. HKS02]|uniref:HD domain-containing phosphohydrolase n=1 Tax=Nostocoides sp. HKS02 TaxID=1813880 RepID=UPI0018A84286|nr:HD domain-containing phosphohydrolase [Tetrasphaera sp. HKS02]
MTEHPRLAELVAALSLATDLGMGQPMEQGLRTCLVAVALADLAGADAEMLAEVYYAALLRFLGCTADAHDTAVSVGGDDIALRRAIAPVLGGSSVEFLRGVLPVVGAGAPAARRPMLVARMLLQGRERARTGVRAHCEAAEVLATRLGLPERVRVALAGGFEQWNGAGLPNGVAGEAIPFSARVVAIARDAEVLNRVGGPALVESALAERTAYDPALAELARRNLGDLAAAATRADPWEAVLSLDPNPQTLVLDLEAAFEVLADFADLKSPYFAGHSRAVSALASAADHGHADLLRQAGLVHDLGRVAVPSGVWARPEPLSVSDFEVVRLHPYYTERILARIPGTAALVRVAGLHHEHLDGSGYHRGAVATEIPYPARVLAAADTWATLTEARPHRPALTSQAATANLRALATSGKLDSDAVEAVLAVADRRPGRRVRGGLSQRELEVLRLLCHGATKKDVAAALVISPTTADHHTRHIYAKIGVHSRAAATLYAADHGLL